MNTPFLLASEQRLSRKKDYSFFAGTLVSELYCKCVCVCVSVVAKMILLDRVFLGVFGLLYFCLVLVCFFYPVRSMSDIERERGGLCEPHRSVVVEVIIEKCGAKRRCWDDRGSSCLL